MNFILGCACLQLKKRDEANKYWCSVVVNTPDDRLRVRAYNATFANASIFEIPELGDMKEIPPDPEYGSRVVKAHMKPFEWAMLDYERLSGKKE